MTCHSVCCATIQDGCSRIVLFVLLTVTLLERGYGMTDEDLEL